MSDDKKFQRKVKSLRRKRILRDMQKDVKADQKVVDVKRKLIAILKPFSVEDQQKIMRAVKEVYS